MNRNLAVVLLAASAGCSLISGPDEERVISSIGYPDAVFIVVPDTVQAGRSFQISVRTYAPDGCWRTDGTEVFVSGHSATVTPYDIRKRDGAADCVQFPQEFTHSLALTLTKPGIAQLNVRGRDGTAVRSVVVQ